MNRAALKTAVRLTLHRLGGLDAAATCCRVGATNLQQYGSQAHPDRHIPADVILDLELIAGEPLITAALARAQGYRLEPVTARQTGDVVSPAQRLGRAAAELSAQLLAALEDHSISPAERDVLLATAGQARQAADAVMASLHAEHKPGSIA